jgi:predicted RNA binding protein YcfA (HicA-like mRNA interferase family)
MPPRRLPYREVRRRLLAAGFAEAGARGSHTKFIRTTPEGDLVAIVPRHPDVAIGTLRSIIRQAGLTLAEVDAL